MYELSDPRPSSQVADDDRSSVSLQVLNNPGLCVGQAELVEGVSLRLEVIGVNAFADWRYEVAGRNTPKHVSIGNEQVVRHVRL